MIFSTVAIYDNVNTTLTETWHIIGFILPLAGKAGTETPNQEIYGLDQFTELITILFANALIRLVLLYS